MWSTAAAARRVMSFIDSERHHAEVQVIFNKEIHHFKCKIIIFNANPF